MSPIAAYGLRISETVASVWFISWAVRRRYGGSDKLSPATRKMRWFIALVCIGFCFISGPEFALLRVISLIIALVFIAWPGAAVHIQQLVARIGALLR